MIKYYLRSFILIVFLGCVSCSDKKELILKHEFLMDTVVEITIAANDREKAEGAIEKAFAEIKRIEAIVGPIEGKELLEVNSNAYKKPVVISGELFKLINKAVNYGGLSEGAFDISIAPVTELWGFLGEEQEYRVPKPWLLTRDLKKVNYGKILLDEEKSTVRFRKWGMKLSLGGIAKGFAVGRAIEVLKGEGIENAIVNAGGDIQVIGDKFGKPWSVGLQHPRKKSSMLTVIDASGNKCIFTSGDYERYFIEKGKRYHHILDPSTGYPADKGCISVTIICNDPVDADALATAVFVLGPDKGMELVEKLPDTEAIIVCKDEEEITARQSKNISGKYKFSY